MGLVNKVANVPLASQMKLARDTLIAYQKAMGVISNNVGNLDTEGYHRQRAMLETRESLDGMPGMIGTGVRMQEIQRVSDEYTDDLVRFENGEVGRWNAQSQDLAKVEEVFSELQSYSIRNAMSEFWNSWEGLANDVDNAASRSVVVQKAENLAAAFNDTIRGLKEFRESVNQDLQVSMKKINTLSENIATLNREIIAANSRGQNPNAMLDQRDQLINELGNIAGVTVQREDDLSMTVYIGSEAVVHRDTARKIVWVEDSEKGKNGGDLAWNDNGKQLSFDGGEMRGRLDVRDEIIPETMTKLDTLANTIRDSVNSLHSEGVAMDGSTGNNFWRTDSSGAADLEVNSELVENPEKIAASRVSPSGDNALAHEIFNLQYENLLDRGNATTGEYYQGIVTDIANAADSAGTRLATAQSALDQAESWQQEVSGVNLDEELSQMIALQRTYTAAGRVMMKLDEMTTIILMMAR